jgi:hypothetical protein
MVYAMPPWDSHGSIFDRRHNKTEVAMTATAEGCLVPMPCIGVEFLAQEVDHLWGGAPAFEGCKGVKGHGETGWA